jgi:hypothetical protein
MKREVEFTYNKPVTSPLSQVGKPGETRTLPTETAQHLQDLGYGWIAGQEPKPLFEEGTESNATDRTDE